MDLICFDILIKILKKEKMFNLTFREEKKFIKTKTNLVNIIFS